jgi:hypothetical protein
MDDETLHQEVARLRPMLLRFHLLICRACSSFEHQMEFLREACRRFPGNDDRD